MSKKYIDFVPVNKKRVTAVKKQVRSVSVTTISSATRLAAAPQAKKPAVKKASPFIKGVSSPVLGVVENVGQEQAHFNKRPLNHGVHFRTKKSEVGIAKSQKVGNRAKPAASSAAVTATAKKEDKSTYKAPKSPFINQDKVKKRPLSKNVYKKEVKAPKEEPKGPVTIITKPDKDAHVSLVVTIILTIILGAAAGTIAFLLLPK